jgi:meiotically up-regulated gene 157 (Mug157) protein
MNWRQTLLTLAVILCLHEIFADTVLSTPNIPTGIILKGIRPPENQRKFVSPIIEKTIQNITTLMKDKALADIFANSFPNTLDTTIETWSEQDTFIITGDIKAMWLRDSTNQIYPYLPFVKDDENLKKLVQGLVRRQAKSVLLDAYANAFYNEADANTQTSTDQTFARGYLGSRVPALNLRIHERKWEVDSLCAVLKLFNGYYTATNDSTLFIQEPNWRAATEKILETLKEQQYSVIEEQDSTGTSYWFSRTTNSQTETLKDGGQYCSISRRTDMIKTAFRPSDDACTFPYNIPQNAMCVAELSRLASIINNDAVLKQHFTSIAQRSQQLASEINKGIQTYGINNGAYAFETDGFSSFLMIDDGNIPSLLSLPFLGYCSKTDPTYLQTRKYVLSSSNPYYFKGTSFAGVGSPHTGYGNIWPMSIIVQAFTSTSDEEIAQCLTMLRDSSNGLIHESFNRNNPGAYSRSWFAWVNSLFGQLILTIAKERPHLLF